ncbi:MAG: hypothetical protein ACIAS6_12525 [Phycisphaerales bacterium JB060]
MAMLDDLLDIYALLFGLFMILALVSWSAYWLLSQLGWSTPLRILGFRDPRRDRALKENVAVCAKCLYPCAGGERCPECGGSYEEPGALLFRDTPQSSQSVIPFWLQFTTFLPLVLLVTLIAPAAFVPSSAQATSAWKVLVLAFPVVAVVGYFVWRRMRR